jgi:hypothetical protein
MAPLEDDLHILRKSTLLKKITEKQKFREFYREIAEF